MPVSSAVGLGAGNVTSAKSASFTPQIWEDDVISAAKTKLVICALFRNIKFEGKGSSLVLPTGIRGVANQKLPGIQVNVQSATEGQVTVLINRHFEASRAIEDIVKIQALGSLRQFYTEDMGYQLQRRKELDLATQSAFLNNGAGTLAFNAAFIGDGSTLYTSGAPNSSAMTDLGLRQLMKRMDQGDIPLDDRSLIVSAGSRFTLLGIPRFTEQAFVGEVGGMNRIRNGQVGDIYGVKVAVSNNMPVATGGARPNILAHRDALVLAEQAGVRVQTQYKLEFLADLIVADTLYGVSPRQFGQNVDIPSAGFVMMTPD